jgi:hypothetical protein
MWPFLTRGRVCLLYMLLALASAVFLGSESLETRDYILLSQIWDFPFRRLLRLAGSRWRCSTPPAHGGLSRLSQSQSHIATDGQSVSKSWYRAPSGAHDQIFISAWQLHSLPVILGISLYSGGTGPTEITSRDLYALLCDVTVYAEVCLPCRCLETGCITPLFHRCSRGRNGEHSLIYCRLLDRENVYGLFIRNLSSPEIVYQPVASPRVDALHYFEYDCITRNIMLCNKTVGIIYCLVQLCWY